MVVVVGGLSRRPPGGMPEGNTHCHWRVRMPRRCVPGSSPEAHIRPGCMAACVPASHKSALGGGGCANWSALYIMDSEVPRAVGVGAW